MNPIIEKVASAIDGAQLWWRYNNWTNDRVKGKPIEVCRYGQPGEDEIVVVARFAGSTEDGEGRLHECVSTYRARVAVEATIEYLQDVVSFKEAISKAIADMDVT